MIKEGIKRSVINEVHWENGLTYSEYRELIKRLLAINQTTGDNQSEKMIAYTILNEKRMNKWDKITKISDSLKSTINKITVNQKWLVLTEAWCGDAAQNLPIINKIAELNPLIELRLLLRDENLDIMDAYLTDGGKSIPKVILMNEQFEELATWGPRPKPVQRKLAKMKSGEMSYDKFALDAHTWYGKDRSVTLQNEMNQLLTSLT